ncbi:MAG: bifunctional adenosylcobinamide kinase/adenosylcobinamide-phosphate guanylyltransferase [Chloroflexota bacterium]
MVLITGGARSGKSHYAQELARKMGGQVLFVATAEAGDEEMRRRIEKHRQSRPPDWRTLEATGHIGSRIEQEVGDAQIVVVDCITLLVGNVFGSHSDPAFEKIEESVLEEQVAAEISELIDCMRKATASFIVVTNEVGLGLVPDNRVGRLYRDLLGKANQMLAQSVDEVILMIAGLPVKVKPSV